MRSQPQALHQDRREDPPAVAECPQLALGAGDPGVIRDRDLDDAEPRATASLASSVSISKPDERSRTSRGSVG